MTAPKKKTPSRASSGDATSKKTRPEERVRRVDGELTQARVFAAALTLFRKNGFDATTMRDIAKASGLSLGAAYHYFPSKDAIVTEIFRGHLVRHLEVATAAFARHDEMSARLRAAFETSFEVRREDRVLLGSLAKITLGDNPASLFSPATEALRQQSIDVFRRAVAVDDVPSESRELLATALWALHLGLLLLFVRDATPHQEKTYRVLSRVMNLLPTLVGLASSPLFGPFRTELEGILAEISA